MAGVRQALEHSFREVGLPEAMLMDHGTPWWNSQAPWGWTELTVWMMEQGIRVLFSGVRHPQTQGKVERMHRALQEAMRKRGIAKMEQSWLDGFRYEYNHVRPHESLALLPPATRWHPSSRPYRENLPPWEYAQDLTVLRLAEQGQLRWSGRRWEISAALRGRRVGIRSLDRYALVYYCNTPLRELDLKTGRSLPLPVNPFQEANL
jgi:hypothetical protein